MATCTSVRVDHLDFTTNNAAGPDIGASIYDPDRQKIYFVYCEQPDVGETARSFPHGVYFREYTPATGVFGTAFELATAAYPEDTIHVEIQRLDDADHTLVVVWGGYEMGTPGYRTRSRESTNDGATWAAAVTVDGPENNRQFVCMSSDGEEVYAFCYTEGSGSGTPGGRELYCHRRTAASTWAAGVLVYDGAGNNAGELQRNQIGADYHAISYEESGTRYTIYCAAHLTATGPDQIRVVCFRTTDNGSTWAEVLIKDYGVVTSLPEMLPQVKRAPDGTLWAVWTDYQDQPNTTEFVTIAKSSDHGVTWTVVGTPTLSLDYNDNAPDGGWQNRAIGFAIDQREGRLYLCTFFGNGATWTYNIIRSSATDPSDLDGWEVFHTCDFAGINEQNRSDMFFAGNQLFYLFNENVDGVYRVSFLVEEVPVIPDIPPPPLVEQAVSGAEENNILLVLDVADEKGWSEHDIQLSSMTHWPEGDYTSERSDPILLGSAPSLDPAIQDPAALIAIWKLFDPERWTKEAFVKNEDDSITPSQDEMEFEWVSREEQLGETGSSNILRAIYVRYRRPDTSFTVEVWLDSTIVFTKTVEPAWPEPGEAWWPIPTDDNVGSRVKLRVLDTADADLIFEAWGIKFRPKKWRMP